MSPGWQAFIVITAMGLVAAAGIVLVRRAETRGDEQFRAGVQDVLNRYASHRTYSSGAAAEPLPRPDGGGEDGWSPSPPAPQTLVGAAVPRPGAPTRLHRRLS